MKQKLLSLLATLLIGAGATLQAEQLSGTCGAEGDNLRWELTPYETYWYKLTITGSGAMQDFATVSDAPWYDKRTLVKTLVLPKGLTHIGKNSFYLFANAPTIEIPEGVESIGDSAFFSCSKMTTLTLPSSLRTIGEDVFYDSRALESVVIPEGVTTLSKYCFRSSAIRSISLPSTLTTIGDYAFQSCSKLEAITIPAGVSNIGTQIFISCNALESITVDPDNQKYDSRENCNAVIEKGENPTLILGCKGTRIPSDIKIIGRAAFEDIPITEIDIPEGVEQILGYAFASSKITALSIPASVKKIDHSAFHYCQLEEIDVNYGNTVYDSRYECNAIIEKPNKLLIGSANTIIPVDPEITTIGEQAFSGNKKLEKITIPANISKLESFAFSSCSGLTELTFLATTPPEISYIYTFDNVTKTIPVYVPEESVDKYKNDYSWGHTFSNIQALQDDRVEIEMYFSSEEITVEVGQDVQLEVMANAMIPHSAWTSADKSIATVDYHGLVHGVKEGETTITVNFPGSEYLKPNSASITIKVTPAKTHFEFCGIKVTGANCKDIFGDGTASYDPETTTLTVYDLEKDANGETAILYENEVVSFNIIINGKCKITNTQYGILCPNGSIYINGGELFLSGQKQQMETTHLLLEDADVTLVSEYGHATPALIASLMLSIRSTAHLLVKATKAPDAEDSEGGLAIVTPNIDFANNLGVLTSGVHYLLDLDRTPSGTFYSDEDNSVWAREVEIGKGAIIVSDSEPTKIDFKNGESDAVVFCSTAFDMYDPVNEQLIISSTVTDDDVTNALASLVPGSSEWMNTLPGSITLYIPAGRGTLSVECKTSQGFTLNVKINKEDAIRINQTEMGEFIVDYDVPISTIVIIYLSGSGSPAPARIATNAKDEEEAGAYIKSITITPEVNAAQPCSEDMQGTCGENLKWVLTCEGELVITGSGAMTDFSSSTIPWSAYRNSIKSISLPDGLTQIGAWAFYQLSEVNTSVVVPEGVTSIGYVAFAGENKLPGITLPSTLETIGGGAFSEDWALHSLVIPAAVKSIGARLTEGCTSLTNLKVDEDNTVFDSREDCNAVIKTATNTLVAGCAVTVIPNTVTTIGEQAFASQRYMTSIKIPNSVTKLDDYCFQYCNAIKVLNLPTSVVEISGSAFTGCKFTTINVMPGNPKFDSRDNCNAIIETATNTLVKGCETTVMPDGITAFGEGAFMSNSNLKFINIPASVEQLDKNALIYCNKLEAITCYATVPPVADNLAFNYGAPSSISINPEIPVYVPGASIEAYKADSKWSYFTNFVALDGYFTVKALATHGTVSGTGTYAAGTKIQLTAIGDEGFEFLEWTDGTHDNPKELTVTSDATVRALFKMTEVTEEVIADLSYQADVMTITWEVVEEATIYIVNLYKNGVFVASYKTTDYVNFIELNKATPAPLRARRSYADEVPGKITIKIEGLEYGSDYSYSIDAYNEEEDVVNVIAGSFNTATVPTDAEQLGSDANAPRKQLRDGKLMIVMPDGKRYDATGVQL